MDNIQSNVENAMLLDRTKSRRFDRDTFVDAAQPSPSPGPGPCCLPPPTLALSNSSHRRRFEAMPELDAMQFRKTRNES